MGNLSNLYISQSFTSLAHLGTNNALVPGTMTQLEDGIGQSLNISFDGTNISSSGNIFAANITASVVNTGSLVTTSSFNSYTQSTNVRLTNIESTTASLNSSVSQLNASSASQQISINAINAVSNSWVTESETGSFVKRIYATSNPLEFEYDLGNGGTNSVTLVAPTGSTINTGSFATTGSNTFTGQQNIQNLLYIEEQGNPSIYTQFSQDLLSNKLQVNQVGASGIDFNTNVEMNELTASLQQGYVWVGNASGITTTIPTSSFGGGGDTSGLVTTASFNAYTSSNNQRVSSLESTTASLLIETQNLELFSASALVSISNLNASSASQQISINALNSATASLFTSASLAIVTASVNNDDITFTKGDGSQFTIQVATGSFAISASFAETASFALNGGVTQILAGPNIIVSPLSGKGQVTISSTGTGSGGFNTATGSYGSFYDTTIQTNPVANAANSMSFNETDITNGVSISGSTSPFNTYIKTENAGVYNLQFSAQVDKTDSGTDEIDIWLRKNGIDLTDTATKLTLTNNNTKVVAAWNWFVQSAANDYYQIIWASADTGMRLFAEPSGGIHPGIPSVIATANRVDQFLSNTGSFSGSFTGTFNGYNLTEFTTTSSFNSYTSSTNSRLTNIESTTASLLIETQNLELFSASALISINSLNGATGSYATTGSNTFIGDEQVVGIIQASDANVGLQGFAPTVFQGIGTSAVAYDQFVNDGNFDAIHIESNLNAGTKFQDYNGSALNTWMQIPTNTGSNPAPQFKRGLEITGSTNIEQLTASLQQGHLFVGNSAGRTTTVATSSFAILAANNTFTAGNTFNNTVIFGATTANDNYATQQLVNNQTLLTKNVSISSGFNSGSFQQLSMSTGSGGNASFQMQAVLSGSTADLSIFNSAGVTSARILSDNITIAKNQGFPNTPATTFTVEATSINLRGNIAASGSTNIIGNTNITGSLILSSSNAVELQVIGDTQFTGSLIMSSSNAVELTVIGASIFTGSVRGNVVPLSITSNTASMDLNLGNYFTLTLANTATTHITATNIQPGTSATLVITTGTNSSASLAPTLLEPSGSDYVATNGSAKKDVLSFVAVDSTNMFVVSTKNMI